METTTKTREDFVSMFATADEAQEYQDSFHDCEPEFLPAWARAVHDGCAPSAEYWKMLCADAAEYLAEARG